jgi:hypothetical protein
VSKQHVQTESVSAADGVRVFLAHDQLMERDSLARALAILRPRLSTRLSEPQALSIELSRDPPQIVIMTTVSREVEAIAPVWILLHEGGSTRCVVSINGRRSEHDALGLAAILNILDDVAP